LPYLEVRDRGLLHRGRLISWLLNNAQAHFRSGKVCNESSGHALLLLAAPRYF
jgi:hypothetical protein